uniref:Cilia- and flagella-associated protein 44 n=1 Tax=Tetraselmis chuii TaxID=63592 RepID=A0A7S1SJP0_9CHLO
MEAELLQRRNQCEMEKLTGEVADMVEAFDEALGKLRREKLSLEADLKQAEIKRLVMYQELQFLKDFEKRENALMEKLSGKLGEKKEVVEKIRQCQESLDQKKSEIDKLIEHKKAVAIEFDELVDDGHNFREPLLKIFMRKIKRSKNKTQGDSDDEDYDSDAEDEDEDEDEDFDDDDEDEEVCPPGCDQVLYEKVCDIREKRLDQEDVIAEFQKGIDNLKKEKEQFSKKQKVVESSLQKINQDIIEFQKEKQGKLNEIDVVVTLSMHQMEYLVDGKLPYDLSNALVFSNTELEKLKSRIKELDQEKIALRRQQQELRKEHQQLLRDKKAKESRIAELDARAYNVQMLKFGQEIDLELLDRIGTTRGAEELQEQLKQQEAAFAKELRQWDRKIEQAQDQMLALTSDNTQCLQTVTKLSTQQKSLEAKLTTTQTSLFNDPVARRRKEIAERDRLVQEVNSQAKEINSLKAQIVVLRRKDTSMYE